MKYPGFHNMNIKSKIKYWYYRNKRIKCKGCGGIYMPYPYYQKIFPRAYHYPNKKYCGFCVYDMDSRQQSSEYDGFY